MASIRKETVVAASPDHVWSALRDVGALHRRLAPGFVVDCRLEGDTRTVTFANGMTVRERIVDIDDAGRRVVWSVIGDPFTHHNASAQVLPADGGGSRFVWIADLLPDELAPTVDALMGQGIDVIRQTMEQAGG